MVALGGMLLDVPSSAISFCHRLLLFPSLCQLWKLKVFSGDLRRSAGPHVFKRASWPWFGFASALKSSSFAVSLQECPEETISTGDYSCRLCACVVLAPRTVASVSGAVTAASVALDNSMRRAERQGMAEMCSRDRSEGAACYESGRNPTPAVTMCGRQHRWLTFHQLLLSQQKSSNSSSQPKLSSPWRIRRVLLRNIFDGPHEGNG